MFAPMTSVAILGGGVAGLSAAHELVERGFDVTVCEARDVFGGKARSIPVPGTGSGSSALPGEHGFRFFPGFYRHLPDTMARIPDGKPDGKSVADHLVPATRIAIAQEGGKPELVMPAEPPLSVSDVDALIRLIWVSGRTVGVSPEELAAFVEALLTLLSSCDARRYEEFEQISWWQYTDAENRSAAFQKFCADGLTRSLVAARAREISARTGGLILCQLLFSTMQIGQHVDRVLDAPTSEVWIDPWTDYLRECGVELLDNCKVTGIDCQRRRVTGVTLKGGRRVVADHYVAAMPVEQLQLLLTPALGAADPRLETLSPPLTVRWMNGVQFYLRQDVPLQKGHTIFIDSEWSLTAISQAQFWPDVDLRQRGDGNVAGVLSVDVSEWDRPGRRTGKPARECSKPEIREEVWGQMVDHLGADTLDANNVVDWFLDPDITLPNPGTAAANAEPLLINTAGSWAGRPDAVTRISNFYIASDFVRTYTDLATMEAANEAARRAVNGILNATHSPASRCKVWKLREPIVFTPLRDIDWLRWHLGHPAKPPVRVTPTGDAQPTGLLPRGLMAATRRRHAQV
jgi:uncharacterized protein with NAD-binding domain and iron-sulfur cluster